MLWIAFGIMLLVAALVVAWPLYREEQRLTGRSALTIVSVLALSAGIYSEIGRPDAQVGADEAGSISAMVESLARRLEGDTGDVKGWKMLGRSYAQLKRYSEAASAFQQAAELEGYTDGQTLVDFGVALMMNDGNALHGHAGELFENALAIAPNNPQALFYGGIAAVDRGEPLVAADRWETLLASSPPPDIEGILRQRIAEWRGVGVTMPPTTTESAGGIELTINVQMDTAASQSIDPDATVFVIARDPAQPAPPVAVVRRRASELPFDVTLSDDNSMIPGRILSNFSNLELIVRASASGQPMAQPGDWFGSQIIDISTTRSLSIIISRQVP